MISAENLGRQVPLNHSLTEERVLLLIRTIYLPNSNQPLFVAERQTFTVPLLPPNLLLGPLGLNSVPKQLSFCPSTQECSRDSQEQFQIPVCIKQEAMGPNQRPEQRQLNASEIISDWFSLQHPEIKYKPTHQNQVAQKIVKDRSRSRDRLQGSKVEDSEEEYKAVKHGRKHKGSQGGKDRGERPYKYMVKILFTPLKRILRDPELANLGIDMSYYFKTYPEPLGGHRTPPDIELVFWYVEEKYRDQPWLYRMFRDYLVSRREYLIEYGKEMYDEPGRESWRKEYRKTLDSFYRALEIQNNSEKRFRSLYSRTPSEQSFGNLRLLQERFYEAGVIARR